MADSGPRLIARSLLALLALSGAGCQLTGRQGPVSESLATCRQLCQQGVAALERGQPGQAEALLADAVVACPVDPDARRYYGEALWTGGVRSEAIAQLAEACRLADEDAALRVRLAEMYLQSGQVERARQTAQQALDRDPKLPSAWAVRGRVLRAVGQPQEALADFHRALGYAPQDREILIEIADLYGQLNWPQRGLATLQSLADTYSPGEEPQRVLLLTGSAYVALGRYEDAVASLSAAADRGEPTAEILYRLAEAEMLAERPDEAQVAVERALAIQPQHGPSRQLLDRLQLARKPQTPAWR